MTVAEGRKYDEEECNVTQEHPSKLSFSIEESVWLNKGQEVEEILGMSLEPEIVIEEKDHHVYIRGGLRLIGEYRPTGTDESSNNNQSLEQQVSFRSAGDVTIASDGSGQIKHFFPIDVTIPLSRIQNLDDVYVEVDSFDYDLPERSCIQLTADISISGMTHHQVTVEKRVEKEIEKAVAQQPEPEEEDVPTAFSFEAKRRPEPEVPAQTESTEQLAAITSHNQYYKPEEKPPAMAGSPTSRYEQPKEEEPTLRPNDSHKELSTDATPEVARVEEVETEQVESTEPVLEAVDEVEEVVEEVREEPAQPETKINLNPLKEIDEQPALEDRPEEEEPDESKSKAPTPREENALYLTKMLSKGEERFSKWRMCIIQENESLDTIADRYAISTSQIVRMNRLQGEQVEEGQILYIPVSKES